MLGDIRSLSPLLLLQEQCNRMHFDAVLKGIRDHCPCVRNIERMAVHEVITR